MEFLLPLSGATLVCDCDLGSKCHGHAIIDSFVEVFTTEEDASDDEDGGVKLDAMSVACAMEGFDEDDDADENDPPAPRFNAEIEAVNETVRSGAANVHAERPCWLFSWVRLIFIIRNATSPVCWEIFAGKASLTREFLRQGWACGPPVDVVYNPDFDVLSLCFWRSCWA